jgi:outer membrane protein assembly factor BamB
MAQDTNALYVPWVDMCAMSSSTGLGALNFAGGTGGLAAINPATGAFIWKHPFTSIDVGAATVANDVVFTSTYAGTTYGISTKNGSVLWSAKAPTGINSFPAVTKNMVIVGAGAPSAAKHPVNEVIAYSLNGQ